jgi:hypothetical protein
MILIKMQILVKCLREMKVLIGGTVKKLSAPCPLLEALIAANNLVVLRSLPSSTLGGAK